MKIYECRYGFWTVCTVALRRCPHVTWPGLMPVGQQRHCYCQLYYYYFPITVVTPRFMSLCLLWFLTGSLSTGAEALPSSPFQCNANQKASLPTYSAMTGTQGAISVCCCQLLCFNIATFDICLTSSCGTDADGSGIVLHCIGKQLLLYLCQHVIPFQAMLINKNNLIYFTPVFLCG